MASRNDQHGNNKWGKQSSKGGGYSHEGKRNRTFDELAAEVCDNVFKDNFKEILQMSKTTQLDRLLSSIEIFAGRPVENQKSGTLGACVTTSQLRNVYDRAKKAKDANALKLIRPNLAYIAGREKGREEEVQKFLAFLDFIVKSVENDEQVKEFQTFFEAVVAYHKFYGKNS
jgi:CRISPR-associated protein Csm2